MAGSEHGLILWTVLDDPNRLKAALEAADWIVIDAARALGVSRQAVYDAMKRHGIERQAPDPSVWDKVMRTRGGRPRRVPA